MGHGTTAIIMDNYDLSQDRLDRYVMFMRTEVARRIHTISAT